MQKISRLCLLGAVAGLLALEPTNAYAYLDPGTGSILLQGIIAGLAGGLLAISVYWRRFVGFFRRPKPTPSDFRERTPDDHA